MQATEASIKNLIINTALAINDLYSALKRDIVVANESKGKVSPLLELVPEMRMNVRFILVDLATTSNALLSVRNSVEKRLHMINLRADMHECYKLLLGFENVRKYTTWSKIGKVLQEMVSEGRGELYETILGLYDAISNKLEIIANAALEKDNRDLAYHYDDDLLKVYQNLLDANNEEEVMKRLSPLFGLLQCVLLFCDQIELVEKLNGVNLPDVEVQNGISFFEQGLLAEYLKRNVNFGETLNNILQRVSQIDVEARMQRGLVRIKEFADEKQMDFPEANDMDKMGNTRLLIRIMLVDIATSVHAFIRSGSGPEYAFNLRRLTITIVSTLEKLYGYDENHREDKLWAYIVKMIPAEDKSLIEEASEIEKILNEQINNKEKSDRVLLVHPMNKKKNNVQAILSKIESVKPVDALNRAESLIKATDRVQKFLKVLMDKLAAGANKKSMESTAMCLKKIQSYRDVINKIQSPESVKTGLLEQMDKLEKLIKEPFSVFEENRINQQKALIKQITR